jgi:HAMP domain-containing protein
MEALKNNWGPLLLLLLGAIGWFYRGKTEQLQTKLDQAESKDKLKDVDAKTAEAKRVSSEAEEELGRMVDSALLRYEEFKRSGNDVPPSS